MRVAASREAHERLRGAVALAQLLRGPARGGTSAGHDEAAHVGREGAVQDLTQVLRLCCGNGCILSSDYRACACPCGAAQ